MNRIFPFIVRIFLALVTTFPLIAFNIKQEINWDSIFIDRETFVEKFINSEKKKSAVFSQIKFLQKSSYRDNTYSLEYSPELFYQLELTKEDRHNIRKLIKNMADLDLWELFKRVREMKKLGQKIRKVHPLRFLGYIFSNYELKNRLIKIRQSPFKWNKFMNGLKERLSLEAHQKNLLKYVSGFSQLVNRHPVEVWDYIHFRDWDRFVLFLM